MSEHEDGHEQRANDSETAERLRRYVLSAGDTREPAEAYKLFRGRLPSVETLLEKRGLV